MEEMQEHYDEQFPPGTIRLERLLDRKHGEIILHPIPTNNPNDPLNWPMWYKSIHYGLVSFYVLMVFVNVDIGTVSWGPMHSELGFSYSALTASFGINCAGLAVGCLLFIPFALKFGRRIVYIFSISASLATGIWQARMMTTGDLFGTNLVSGLAGAIAETICQMTIADVFFVHQRATANAVYLTMSNAGGFLAPVAAGYAAASQGWRWIWWWTTILFGICLVAFLFLYEDTKFDPVFVGSAPTTEDRLNSIAAPDGEISDNKLAQLGITTTATSRNLDESIPRKTYSERIRLFPPGSFDGQWKLFFRHSYQPFIILFTFPAITYTALIYGSILAWFSVVVNVWSIYFTLPPYNFSSSGIGLMNLPPFIGGVIGSLIGGLLNDRLAIILSRRNKGIFEPEMRLWVAIPAVFVLPGGILLFGLATAYGMPWIVACIGSGLFGFAMFVLWDAALTYAMDCYVEIIGDAMMGICFVRNLFATIVAVTITYWINGMGLQNMFVLTGVLSFVLAALTFPMMYWGKDCRRWTHRRLLKMAQKQFSTRG